MHKKGRKIKRYKGSFDTKKFRRRKIIRWTIALILLFGASYFLAPPILDFGTQLWYIGLKGQSSSSASSDISSSEINPSDSSNVESVPEQPVEPTPEPTPQPEPQGDWQIVGLEALATPELAQQTAQQLASQGIKYAMVCLKGSDGVLHYASGVPLAGSSISASPFDAAAAAAALKQAGIIPVAEIWAYRDPLAPYAERSFAINYGNNEGMLWLDNSASAGGKPWLNPYSAGARQYIQDLALEIVSMGYQHIVFSGLQFPEVNSLSGANFGDTAGKSQDAILNETIQHFQTLLQQQGATAWFQYPATAITGQDLRLTGIPAGNLVMERLIVQMPNPLEDPAGVFSACNTASAGKTKLYRLPTPPDQTIRQIGNEQGYQSAVIG